MINSITITNHLDESITLEMRFPEQSGFLIFDIDGLDPSKASINTTEVSTMDGGIFNMSRVNERNIVLTLKFLEDNLKTIEERRHDCYKYFPIKKRVKIRIDSDTRVVEVYGYIESNVIKIFSDSEGAVISIICPDSYLYNINNDVSNLATVEPSFEFPFSNESLVSKLLEFGDLTISPTANLSYTGDASIGVVIYITVSGPVTDLAIKNTDTLEKISIDDDLFILLMGSGIHQGDFIVISTVKGNKYASLIRNNTEYNIINTLGKYPDWFQLEKGSNSLAFTASSGLEYLSFEIINKIAYEGI